MSYQVFISHSSKDSELARDLARRLEEAGAKVFTAMDSFRVGEELNRAIHHALREADELVVLLTDNAAFNSNVMYELGVADSLDKRVTPVIVNEGAEQRVPMIGRHFIRYAELPKYISSLKRRVKAA